MNELIEFLTSKEIIVVYIVAGIACLLCFIIYLIDKNYDKRKRRHNTRELNKLVAEIAEVVGEENDSSTEEIVEEPILYEVPELVKNEEIEELTFTKPIVLEEISKSEVLEEPIVSNVDTNIFSSVSTEPVMSTNNFYEKPEPVSNDLNDIETLSNDSFVSEKSTVLPANFNSLEVDSVESFFAATAPIPVVEEPIENLVLESMPEEELVYTDVEPNPEEARRQLRMLTEELAREDEEKQSINVDLTAYEEEQESSAIISLEELVKKSKEMYAANELSQYADEGNEPISLKDLEKKMQEMRQVAEYNEPFIIENVVDEIKPEELDEMLDMSMPVEVKTQLKLDDFDTVMVDISKAAQEERAKSTNGYKATRKFQSSPVISPIYGIEKKETSQSMELENTANYEKLDEEIKKTNEFLMTLKELQKHLD